VRVTNDSFYDGPPAINCMGQVVWSKRINNDFDREEIFLHDIDGTVRQITDDNVRDAFPDINDEGVIVWSRQVGPGGTLEVARYEDGEITILTDNEYSEFGPRVNNRGHIAWHQHWYRGCSEADIFFYDGARIQRITQDGFSNQGVSINDSDELVWTRYDFCQNPWRGTQMYRNAEGDVIELSDGADQSQGAYINNQSQIVWGTDPDGIILWDDGRETLITDWGHPAGINDMGLVSVNRWHEDIEVWQQWVWIDGKMMRITEDASTWNHSGAPNRWGELGWQSQVGGRLANSEIHLLTWRKGNGDIDGNHAVDDDDYEIFAGCTGGPDGGIESCSCHRSDLDHDGDVDLGDFTYLQRAFGRTP
jgi:hypothetical protein